MIDVHVLHVVPSPTVAREITVLLESLIQRVRQAVAQNLVPRLDVILGAPVVPPDVGRVL